MSDEAAIDFARRLFGSRTPEQRQRDAAVLGPMHDIGAGFDGKPQPEQTAPPDFDGGPRETLGGVARFGPRPPPLVAREPGGWESVEVGGWLLGLPNETP